MHKEDSPFPMVNSQGRLECKGLWGASVVRTSMFLPERSSGLSIPNPVMEAGGETSIILEYAGAT